MSRLRMAGLRFRGGGPIDLELSPGECVALSGPSGTGKTLLLRAVADLDPHEGHLLLDGRDCQQMEAPEWRRQVAMLPAESRWWHDRVGAHFPAGEPAGLQALGLTREALDWPVDRLSTGERQRLAILRCLAGRPQALLLDEPTANLDPASRVAVETLIESYRKEEEAVVLWVTHDVAQARRVARRRFTLARGQLVPEDA